MSLLSRQCRGNESRTTPRLSVSRVYRRPREETPRDVQWVRRGAASPVNPLSRAVRPSGLSFLLSLFPRPRSFSSGGFATIAHHVLLIRLASGRVSPEPETEEAAREEGEKGGRGGSRGRRKTEKRTKKRGDGVIYKPTGTTQSEATPGRRRVPPLRAPFRSPSHHRFSLVCS